MGSSGAMQSSGIRLVTRGDDAGSFRAANLAIAAAFDRGLIRNSSIMVPAPHFLHAAELFRERPGLCLGLHVTLNAEWIQPRWAPVLPAAAVSSLVDEEGLFLPTPMDLFNRGALLDQAMLEIKAQLARARQSGLVIRYLDEHMGVGWIHERVEPGGSDPARAPLRLHTLLRELAEDEGLVWHERAHDLPPPREEPGEDPLEEPWQALVRRIDRAAAGTYVVVWHPALDSDETRAVALPGQAPGAMAADRAADLALASSPDLARELRRRNISCIRYDEI
jgi:predicted glycoside hydrolase/deacetylase ChbG (UPF0249 family)